MRSHSVFHDIEKPGCNERLLVILLKIKGKDQEFVYEIYNAKS